jgi:hypothetical protein
VVLVEFKGEEMPVREVSGALGCGGESGKEVGWYRLKRVYT